nr:hypothetical protein [Desulfobulbaceae bacterium]
MGNGWRYRLQHLGDAFADMLEATVVAARRSAAGIVIDLQLHDLEKKKGKVAARIGTRIIEMREENPDFLVYDAFISECYEELDLLLDRIEACYEDKKTARERLRRILDRLAFRCTPETSYEDNYSCG